MPAFVFFFVRAVATMGVQCSRFTATMSILIFNKKLLVFRHRLDAFYDRGSTFPLSCFLKDGAP